MHATQKSQRILPSVNPLRRGTLVVKSRQLQDELLLLGSMLEKALENFFDAFRERDLESCWALLVEIGDIKGKRATVEAGVLTLMATQHPVAGDLRTLAAVLEISSELEQMGRHLEETVKLGLLLDGPFSTFLADVHIMAREVRKMLHQALSAFAMRDLELASGVAAADDRVDHFYERANLILLEPGVDPESWGNRLHMLRMAHHLERMGDRVVNICEWVHYTVTGELLEMA